MGGATDSAQHATASPSMMASSALEAANRFGDCREPIGEVRAASAPDLDALDLLAGEDAKTVMLDLMQPSGSDGRPIDERGLAWANETGRRVAAPQGRGGAPPCCGLQWRSSKPLR